MALSFSIQLARLVVLTGVKDVFLFRSSSFTQPKFRYVSCVACLGSKMLLKMTGVLENSISLQRDMKTVLCLFHVFKSHLAACFQITAILCSIFSLPFLETIYKFTFSKSGIHALFSFFPVFENRLI